MEEKKLFAWATSFLCDSSAAEQVAASSNDLADGAANQAAVVEKLTATVAGVSEQVEQNSESAKKIMRDPMLLGKNQRMQQKKINRSERRQR